ncbi:MAG: M28 family peptidase [Candidatus Coatesbacteria bacterium]|nr:MAG: M28 family peptidase [Candidatus Coatesbacteria bacterium]
MRYLLTSLVLIPVFAAAADVLVMIPADVRADEDRNRLAGFEILAVGEDYVIAKADESALTGEPEYELLDVYDADVQYLKVYPANDEGAVKARSLGVVLFERDHFLLVKHDGDVPADFDMRGILNIVPVKFDGELLENRAEPLRLEFNPCVDEIVGLVEEKQYKGFIQDLEDFVTRNARTTQYYDACLYALGVYESYGLDVELDEFYAEPWYGEPFTCWNVVAEKPGIKNPETVYIICGHLDSTAGSPNLPESVAPGADDNASASAAALEAARVMQDFDFINTIRYINFGAEEQGLCGSYDYAYEAYLAGEDIQGVVNIDMVLYAPIGGETLYVPYNDDSEALAKYFQAAAGLYVPDIGVATEYWPDFGGSDHYPFWYYGYPAILGIEIGVWNNPYYHTTQDILANYEEYFPFGTNAVKTAVATIASLAEPVPLTDIHVEDFAAGAFSEGIELSWGVTGAYSGFNLYRSNTLARTDAYDKLNVEPITGTTPFSYTDFEVMENTAYNYWLEAIDLNGLSETYGPVGCTWRGSSPFAYALYQSRPNPSSGTAVVAFDLPEAADVTLAVYDISGRKITVPVDESLDAGEHETVITGLSPGLYVYKLDAGVFNAAKKMVVVE